MWYRVRDVSAPYATARVSVMKWQTWSPFQSSEVREICENLTSEESHRLAEFAAANGAQLGGRIGPAAAISGAMAMMILVAIPGLSTLTRWLLFAGVMLLMGPIVILLNWRWMRETQQRSRELLCSSRYARERGVTPDQLRLFSFSRKHQAEFGRAPPDHFFGRTRDQK